MSEAMFTMEQLEPELRNKLMAEAEAERRSVAQIVIDLIRNHFEERRQASYNAFLRRCVEAGDADIRAGRFHTNEEVSAEFAALRATVRAEAA
ncbi:MAG: antitoxin of toxin-antitoxin stability system [Zoogloeaceae bacterium]|jgi:predicted transcriptional regulator|nr:antitoxin of toxin-antitoxin stability system [Zoogloeaceae bacterium]